MATLILGIPTPIVVWGSFLLAGLGYYLIAAFVSPQPDGRKSLLKCFVAGEWSHKSAITDVMSYLINKAMGVMHLWAMPIITLFIAGFVTSGVHGLFPAQHSVQASIPIFLFCALVLILFSDFSGWLSHVAQHYVPVLWELHKVHHSALFSIP